ncbi:MAG: aldo/keto reductase [Chloroflexota bacterium]
MRVARSLVGSGQEVDDVVADGAVFNDLTAASVRKEVEDSLQRLGVKTIDLYQIHWPNPDPQIEEGWGTMAELQQEGKLRWIGVSNFDTSQMDRARNIAPITSLQPPYSAVKPGVENEILPYCGEHNIGVIVYSPMQAGLLTGKMTRERIQNMPDNDWRKGDDQFKEPQLTRNLNIAAKMEEIAQRHGVTTPAVSIAWVLRRPEVTAAIVGARRPDQVDGIIGGGTFRLSDDEIAELETVVRV